MIIWVQLTLLVVVVVIGVAGYFIWDRRYRGAQHGNFKRTNEVFKDPTTGKKTRVYEDLATGERRYRDEP